MRRGRLGTGLPDWRGFIRPSPTPTKTSGAGKTRLGSLHFAEASDAPRPALGCPCCVTRGVRHHLPPPRGILCQQRRCDRTFQVPELVPLERTQHKAQPPRSGEGEWLMRLF